MEKAISNCWAPPYDVSVNFKKNDYNEPILELRVSDIMWLWLSKVTQTKNSNDYLGSYYSDELKTQYNLVKREGEFYLTHPRLDDIKITQITKGNFSSKSRNFFDLRFKRDKAGKVIAFSVSNDGIKNITFSKK